MEKRKDNLMRWVVGGHGFVRAYHSVLRNKGAAGVDGMQTEDLRRHLAFHWESIKTELLNGEYRPQLARGVKIPKPSGGVRQLGIPTVLDRMVQQSIHQVLSLIWEKEFSVFSYGFRHQPFSGEETPPGGQSRENEDRAPGQLHLVRPWLRAGLQERGAGQVSTEYSQEKLGTAQGENQGNHPQGHAENSTGANRGIEPTHARLGQLLQACHRVPEVQGFRRLDTLPAALLYLEAMETAQTQNAGLSSVRRGSELGEAICLLPQGRLGDRL